MRTKGTCSHAERGITLVYDGQGIPHIVVTQEPMVLQGKMRAISKCRHAA